MTPITRHVSLAAPQRPAQGYLALPDTAGPCPGVVVIQEWWGLNEHIRSIADRFARAGFAALAPDLYNGQVATEPDEARKLAMAADWDAALAVIQAAIDFLRAQEAVAPKVIGVAGYCMGGGLAWHAAAKLDHVGGTVSFYGGGPPLSDAEVARISAPVMAIYGELDAGVPPSVAAERAAQMESAGVTHETIVYPGAQHAFFNDTRPGAYHAVAAADAWLRMTKFFQRVLAGARVDDCGPFDDES